MSDHYILALDQGTTSSRALLVNSQGKITHITQKEFTQIYPRSGWVEHDPQEIWNSQKSVMEQLIQEAKISPEQIQSIGITNQRETTVVWNRHTGKAIYNAIVWQDKRTSDFCEELTQEGLGEYIHQHTGLLIDAYFSATKAHWILENVEGAKELAQAGDLLMGTIDSWLIWNLSQGESHVSDYSNVSRTLLYDIQKLDWDKKLLDRFGIPKSMLPTVVPSSGQALAVAKVLGHSIPISGIAGDQQAALFGQTCFEPGMAKNTYGTGCFILMNTGLKAQFSERGLLTTIAWGKDNQITYAQEGSIFIAGAAIQWLRDGLKLIDSAEDTEYFANKALDKEFVYVVPAFAGLGTPYWDMNARGAIFGLTRDSDKATLIKATLESLAYQTRDVIEVMVQDTGIPLKKLLVDGGAAANNFMMQFQADMLNVSVERPKDIESTALGAAYLAGLGSGMWQESDILAFRHIERTFEPEMEESKRKRYYRGWKVAVNRSKNWLKDIQTDDE